MEETKKATCECEDCREPCDDGCDCGCGEDPIAKVPKSPPAPDWESLAKYKAAELENYIKRQKDAVQIAFNDGRTNVLMTILPLVDSLYEAIKTVKDENDRKGIEILTSKFEAILTNLGLEEIPVKTGDKFDPYIHTCVTVSEKTDNKIQKVWQKGYRFAGRIIRPTTVSI